MKSRVVRHIIFWFGFAMLYVISSVLFAAPSDMVYPFGLRSLRAFFNELAFLPWKMIPFYFLFYFLIPKYFQARQYLKIAFYLSVVILGCVIGYRSMIFPVTSVLYNESPDFDVFSLKRIFYTLTEILPALGLASAAKLLLGRISFEQKQKALQQEKQLAELNFLKAQTNPHFLFNTLNNLYGLARKNDDRTAPSIMKLSRLMRYILQEGSAASIPIRSEIKIIENYIDLERLRHDDRLSVLFNKAIDELDAEIAPLILLPFVENAFKHGPSEARFESEIAINLVLQKGKLTFSILNSVPDREGDIVEGIGLKNIKRQLKLIYGNRHQLKIEDKPDNFSVILNIDLNPNDA